MDPNVFIIFPLGQVLLFGVFMGAAMVNRRKPECHRRFVLLATICLMAPAAARLPFVDRPPLVALALSSLFIVAGMLHDRRTRGRAGDINIRGPTILRLSGSLRFGVARTAAVAVDRRLARGVSRSDDSTASGRWGTVVLAYPPRHTAGALLLKSVPRVAQRARW